VEQKYPRLEYLVQDLGATAEASAVLRAHQAHLTRWRPAHGRGLAGAPAPWWRGTAGEILAHLSSGTLLLPGALAYVARYFAENPAVEVVYGHRTILDGQGRAVGRWLFPPHGDAPRPGGEAALPETLFWRRSLGERVGRGAEAVGQAAPAAGLLQQFRAAGARLACLPRCLDAFPEGAAAARACPSRWCQGEPV
jgi:hypothetical protein